MNLCATCWTLLQGPTKICPSCNAIEWQPIKWQPQAIGNVVHKAIVIEEYVLEMKDKRIAELEEKLRVAIDLAEALDNYFIKCKDGEWRAGWTEVTKAREALQKIRGEK